MMVAGHAPTYDKLKRSATQSNQQQHDKVAGLVHTGTQNVSYLLAQSDPEKGKPCRLFILKGSFQIKPQDGKLLGVQIPQTLQVQQVLTLTEL
jgi:hypothetical protein